MRQYFEEDLLGMSFWAELRRRNVFRMAILYIVSGWLILQVADLLFDLMGVPDWALRMVLALLIVGLPVALAFSWLYELTPEGLKRESQVPRDQSITPHTGRKLNHITLVVGLVAIALVSYQQFFRPPGPSTPAGESAPAQNAAVTTDAAPASIAVLPFANLSGSDENEYFSDGLTETLLHGLAKIPDLQVAARTSSFAFKGKDSDIREIAGALGVAHVLEGSVQRSGDRVRITAQLIRASDGFHVWTENFDRTLDDIFAIQDEIAAEVGRALSVSLGLNIEQNAESLVDAGTTDLSAYDLFLRALSEIAVGSFGSLQQAEQLLKQALSEDPGFIDAKTQLGIVYGLQARTGMLSSDEANQRAMALFDQVLAARPDDITARTNQLMIQAIRDFESGNTGILPELLENLRALIDREPNNTEPRKWLATVLRRTGQESEALAEIQQLLELDPLNTAFINDLGDVYHDLDEFHAASEALRRSLEIEPGQSSTEARLAHFATHTGDAVSFLEHYIRAMELDPQDHELPAGIAIFLYQFGLSDQADWFLARAEAIEPTAPAVYHARLERALSRGETEQANKLAREMISSDMDNRHGSEDASFGALFDIAVRNDHVQEALAFVEKNRPGFRAVGQFDVPFEALATRLSALGALSSVLTEAEMAGMIEGLVEVFSQFGVDFANNPLLRIQFEALAGDPQEAIQIALDDLFTEPPTRFTSWDSIFDQPHLADLVADPRIQAAMVERREAEARVAETMRRYLAEQTDFGIPS
ncbi:MAG: hypothetical protein R3200_15590 [Xanthomonadales bacterium]|nr:hypothetical protein [Xanthomonadales bacterium]